MINNKILRTTKYPFILLATLSILLALIWGATGGKADTKTDDKFGGIDPDCYAIYQQAMKMQGQSEDNIIAMAYSMYTLATKKGDRKAQLMAMQIATNYYESAGPQAIDKLRDAVEVQCNFAISTGDMQYYYSGLSSLILHYISYGKYMPAATEIEHMQDMAFKSDNAYGISQSHYLMAQLYQAIGMNQTAIQELKVGMEYAADHNLTNCESQFLFALLQQYDNTDNIDSARVYLERLEDDPTTTVSQDIYSMLTLASHYRKQQQWKQLGNQLQRIEKKKENTFVSTDYLSAYLQNKAIYLSHAQGDSARALQLCQRIRVKSIKYDTEREIYQHFGNYEQAFKAKKQYYSQNSSTQLRQLLSKTKTIESIVRLNHLQEQQKEKDLERSRIKYQRDSIARLHEQYQLEIEQKEAAARAEEYSNMKTTLANFKLENERRTIQKNIDEANENALHANKQAERAQQQSRRLLGTAVIAGLVGTLVTIAIRLRSRKVKEKMIEQRTREQQKQTELKDKLLLNLHDDLKRPIQELRDRVTIIDGTTDIRIANIMSKAIHQRTSIITQLVDEMIDKTEQNISPVDVE